MSLELDYKNYINFIDENFPTTIIRNESELKEYYYLINDFFILCDVILSLEEITSTLNYYNLLKEFQSYISRLLLAVVLNDKYLIDNLIRLLIEKLYRVLYGYHYLDKQESTVRNHTRSVMSTRLETLLSNRQLLDDLYGEYSELIHHTSSTPDDLLNLRTLFIKPKNLLASTTVKLKDIQKIFIEDFFNKMVKDEKLTLASRLVLENRLSEFTKSNLLIN